MISKTHLGPLHPLSPGVPSSKLPSREEMREIVIRTSALSGRREGSIRYWASSGTGNLGLIPAGDAKPAFFVMIFGGLDYPERYYAEGMRVMTTTYPIKPPLYAVTKSTNYLPNTLMQMGSEGTRPRQRDFRGRGGGTWARART